MQNQGWIKIHRTIRDWDWYLEPDTLRVFLHCLIRANHTPSKWKGVEVGVGEFISSPEKIGEELNLGRQTVRTCIKRLKSTSNLTTKSTNKNTLFKVNNYEFYQGANQQTNQLANQQLTNNQPTTNQQLTTNKNNKNNKNEKNEKKLITNPNGLESVKTLELFNSFYQLYPKKKAKADALKAFRKIKPAEYEAVMSGLKAQLPQLSATEPQFRPLPATWLNGRRWEDELDKDTPKTDEQYTKEYSEVGYSRFKTLYGKDLADKFFQLTMKI